MRLKNKQKRLQNIQKFEMELTKQQQKLMDSMNEFGVNPKMLAYVSNGEFDWYLDEEGKEI